ncbi:hypothetical protein [Dysgonomonas sp. 520]|uniref:hypothetical protein n=1 Tax=Dysgonomonas sp. 520 TaxID=2302931 RepID=UPI0013D0476C|nr:hypothetical protein [Dysgonomonas sp. 520]NDW10057.1 hypothetical protein [Dysgonomonas sp. 520]
MKTFKTKTDAYFNFKRELIQEFSKRHPNFFNGNHNPDDDEIYLGQYIHQYTKRKECGKCGSNDDTKEYTITIRHPYTFEEISRTAFICLDCGKSKYIGI